MSLPRRVYLPTELSESEELSHAIRELVGIKRSLERLHSVGVGVAAQIDDTAHVIAMLSTLKRQAKRGVHRNPYRGHRPNPQLVIYNPPDLRVKRVAPGRVVGQIASNVHEIRYEHAEDGKFYKHEFGRGVKMFAINGQSHEVLLTSDVPLWEDF